MPTDLFLPGIRFRNMKHPNAICFLILFLPIRKDVLLRHNLRFQATYMPAEDYKLWVDVVKVAEIVNLEKPLLNYRESTTQISKQKSHLRISNANLVRTEMLNQLGIVPTPEQLNLHASILDDYWHPNEVYFGRVFDWFDFILKNNRKTNFFVPAALGQALGKILFRHWLEHTSLNFNPGKLFRESEYYKYYQPPAKALLKLAPYYRSISFHSRKKVLL
ncbi:MAG: glycosyl transferase family 2 [Adhaeribacter sp.]|nr:glycosyl transferase family 2 [Adhaeribacter sp.]